MGLAAPAGAEMQSLSVDLEFRSSGEIVLARLGADTIMPVGDTANELEQNKATHVVKLLNKRRGVVFEKKVAADLRREIVEDLGSFRRLPTPDSLKIHLSFPSSEVMEGFLVVMRGEQILLEQPFDLCNENNQCDAQENFYSCPEDCPRWAKDGACVSAAQDGGCDPDCRAIDMDCKLGMPPGVGPRKSAMRMLMDKWDFYVSIGLGVGSFFFVAFGTVFFLFKRRKPRGIIELLGMLVSLILLVASVVALGILLYLKFKFR